MVNLTATPRNGAEILENGACRFRVWAPCTGGPRLRLSTQSGRVIKMEAQQKGYFEATVDAAGPGTTYSYVINGQDLPDPASRFQPDGVHGPSQVIDSRFDWQDASWAGLPIEQYIFYELHVGAFTPEG